VTEDAELQLAVTAVDRPLWDVVAGVRQELQTESPQTWPPSVSRAWPLYAFEAGATASSRRMAKLAARLEGEYDILLTNRLILQPTAEMNFLRQDDPERRCGVWVGKIPTRLPSALRDCQASLHLYRVSWSRSYGKTGRTNGARTRAVM